MIDQTTEPTAADTAPLAPPASALPPEKRRTPRWLLPALLIIGALLLLNLGLYLRLTREESAQPATSAAAASAAPPPVVVDAAPSAAAVAAPPAAVVVASDTPWQYAAAFVDGALPSAWQPFAGDWVVENGELIQRDAAGFDQGIVYAAETFGRYTLAARYRLLQGAGAGVLFNLPQIDKKNGGHLVRFTDDGAGLFWGNFDAAGVFTGQGFAGVGAPGDAAHVLEVDVGADAYAIRLDGRALAGDIPLLSRAGYAGLITNQAAAAYSAFSAAGSGGAGLVVAAPAITAAPTLTTTAAVTTTPGVTGTVAVSATAATTTTATVTDTAPLDLEAISGDWQQEGDAIYQLKTAGADFSLSTGIAGESYRLAVSITMTDSGDLGDMGAGVLFHMPNRTDNKGAQLVRFVNAGQGLAWGSFSDTGAFQGDGYVDLNLTPGEPHALVLTVEGNKFAVTVDDQPVVQDIPTVRDNGWLALTTFRGPVEFANMQLQLGSIVK